jgi:hypothetical protein
MPSAWYGTLGAVQPRPRHEPFPLLDVMPPALRATLPHCLWSHDRLWALKLHVEPVSVGELRWHLALPMWSFEGVPFAISPEQVRDDPDRFHVQYARTMAADLTLPLHALVRAGRPRTLLDGVHRLLKADLLGHAMVAVKDLPAPRLDDIAVGAPYPVLQTRPPGRACPAGKPRAGTLTRRVSG